MSLPSVAHARNARRQFVYAINTDHEHDLYGPVNTVLTHQCDLAMAREGNRAFYSIPQGIVSVEQEYKLSEIQQRLDPDFRPSPSVVGDVGDRRRSLRRRGDGQGVGEQAHPQPPHGEVADEDEDQIHDEGEQQQEVEEVVGRVADNAEGELEEPPVFGQYLQLPHDGNLTGNAEDHEENDPPVTGPSYLESDVPAPPSPALPPLSAAPRLSAVSTASHTSTVTTMSSMSGTQTTVTTISNDSKRVVRFTRLPDFRLDMALLNRKDKEIGRHTIAVVEVKRASRKADAPTTSTLAAQLADDMLPQVIQAVQVVFANDLEIDEVAAMLIVDEFCRFMYFRRGDVVDLDPIVDGRVFKDPGASDGNLSKFARRRTIMVQMVYGVRSDVAVKFGHAFVTAFKEFVNWAKGKKQDADEYRFPFSEQL